MRRSESKHLADAALEATVPAEVRIPRFGLGLIAALLVSSLVLSMLAGCSGTITMLRGEAVASAESASEPTSTGSIVNPPASFGKDLDDEDWRRARAALAVALDPQGNGRPVKWDNPDTAMRGTISPTGLPYVANDEICRDFLASIIAPSSSRFVRGTGCKPSGSTWGLKKLRASKA